MQRNTKRATAVGVIAVLLLAFSAIPAVADDHGAIVQKDFFTGGPVFTPLGVGTITNSNYVQTPSGNWVISIQGELNDLDNAPDRAQRWTHDTLATFCFQPGDEFNLRVNPTGRISLTCWNP